MDIPLTIFFLLSFLVGLLLSYKENWEQKAKELLDAVAIIILRGNEMRFHKKILWGILTCFLWVFIILCVPTITVVEIMSGLRPIITSRKKGKNRRS